MKKATWIKIAATGVAAVPPVVVLLINMPVFIQNTGKSLSAASIFVILILALIFRDATKKFISTPSAFKTCLIVFILSLIAVNLGEQMLQISATALVSGACAVPLNMWYNNETKEATTDDVVNALKDLIKEKDDEGADEEN